MKLKFSKMQALGNDFIVLNVCETGGHFLNAQKVKFLADRHLGIGCDQLLALAPSTVPKADFDYWIFNADGSRVYQCGNGARALARYVFDRHLLEASQVRFYTGRDILVLEEIDEGQYALSLPEPKEITLDFSVDVNGDTVKGVFVDIGNPHFVMFVDHLKDARYKVLAETLQKHRAFPHSVNVGFAQLADEAEINLRVFERGAGETLACGSGAAAAAIAARETGAKSNTMSVQQAGGRLSVNFSDEGVQLVGPALFVFEGEITV